MFQPGTRLGPYEIEDHVGTGGMGVVYRARDTRLGRRVAIKVLPTEVAADPGRRERLQREARAIASVAHPHICTLHDVGSEGDHEFIVMEYIEGETLAARIAKGPLPLDVALRHGSQIASALSAAHRAGIVHRDLKPSNVMLTRAGVKLLDFGLAKARGAGSPADGSSVTGEALTVAGSVIGTVPYMSPEQVDGAPVDWRTDIFAFGTVLFEMVTGRRAFDAPTQSRLIVQILEHDPPDLKALQPLAPPSLERFVRRCLAKNPDDRWQSTADLAGQLDGIREHDLPGKPSAQTFRPMAEDETKQPVASDRSSSNSAMDRWVEQQTTPAGETSGKAIASLVCGILFFLPLASIAAIILGHLARRDIRRSEGRLQGSKRALAGLILGYVTLATFVIAVMAASIVPGLARARASANESSVISALRQINSAQAAFSASCGGYAPSFQMLHLRPSSGSEPFLDPGFAVHDDVTRTTEKNDYIIAMRPVGPIAGSRPSCVNAQDPIARDYLVTAVPKGRGVSGFRFFATSAAGVVYYDSEMPITAIHPDGTVIPGTARRVE